MIYVGGGNTANMLAIWRIHGVDKALEGGLGGRRHPRPGRRPARSAGSRAGLTDSFGPRARAAAGRPQASSTGSFCPHYDSESLRRPRYHELIATGKLPDGYAADDGVGILFSGNQLAEVVAAMPEPRAFRVEQSRGGVEETSLKPRLLRG